MLTDIQLFVRRKERIKMIHPYGTRNQKIYPNKTFRPTTHKCEFSDNTLNTCSNLLESGKFLENPHFCEEKLTLFRSAS